MVQSGREYLCGTEGLLSAHEFVTVMLMVSTCSKYSIGTGVDWPRFEQIRLTEQVTS